MSMWGEVFQTLRTMTIWQLLCAFVACTGYALAQGRLVGPRVKGAAAGLALLAAAAFVLESERWVDGIVLLAVAVAGMGLFAATVWLMSRLLGMTTANAAAGGPADSRLTLPPPDADGPVGHGQPIAGPARPAPSH